MSKVLAVCRLVGGKWWNTWVWIAFVFSCLVLEKHSPPLLLSLAHKWSGKFEGCQDDRWKLEMVWYGSENSNFPHLFVVGVGMNWASQLKTTQTWNLLTHSFWDPQRTLCLGELHTLPQPVQAHSKQIHESHANASSIILDLWINEHGEVHSWSCACFIPWIRSMPNRGPPVLVRNNSLEEQRLLAMPDGCLLIYICNITAFNLILARFDESLDQAKVKKK